MNADEGFEDEGPFSPWVPPDDRLWRHPSESTGAPTQPFAYQNLTPARSSVSRPWATVLIAGVVGALLASGIGVASGGFVRTTVIRPYTVPISPTTTSSISTVQEPTLNWSLIYEQVENSVVLISGSSDAGPVSTSGMLWKTDASGEIAYILAADQDLEGLGNVNVAFYSGSVRGQVIGTDPETGLAVIAVAARSLPAGADSSWPSLGHLTDIRVGDNLATVDSGTEQSGSFANGAFATGSVSSLYDSINNPNSDRGMVGLIAVDTPGAVAPGAAVVESNGSVVGLTVESGSGDSNTQYSYAVSMDVASTIATQLINGERPWHPWIGVLQAQDLPTSAANSMGLSGGAVVESVSPGSPAAQAGLSPSDVITGLGNNQIQSTGTLLEVLNQCTGQSAMSLRYLHKGKPVTTTITVTSQPADPSTP